MLDAYPAAAHPCAALGTLLRPADDGARAGACPITLDPALLAVAGRHHLVPGLASALATRGLVADDAELAAYLEAIHALNADRNRRLLAQAAALAAALAEAEIRPLFLKGTAMLLRGDYPAPSARFLGDIDVLLAPDAIEPAAHVLARLGYHRKKDGPPGAHDRVKLHHPDHPAQVELHHPAVPRHLAPALPPAAMRARALPVASLPGAALPTATDLAVHLVLHAMLHDQNLWMAELPMREGLDLALLARDPALDWDDVRHRLARLPAGTAALGFCLAAAGAAYPWAPLPRLPLTRFAAGSLRAWRARRGRPTGRLRRRLANVVEHSGATWRRFAGPGRILP